MTSGVSLRGGSDEYPRDASPKAGAKKGKESFDGCPRRPTSEIVIVVPDQHSRKFDGMVLGQDMVSKAAVTAEPREWFGSKICVCLFLLCFSGNKQKSLEEWLRSEGSFASGCNMARAARRAKKKKLKTVFSG